MNLGATLDTPAENDLRRQLLHQQTNLTGRSLPPGPEVRPDRSEGRRTGSRPIRAQAAPTSRPPRLAECWSSPLGQLSVWAPSVAPRRVNSATRSAAARPALSIPPLPPRRSRRKRLWSATTASIRPDEGLRRGWLLLLLLLLMQFRVISVQLV